MIKRVLGPLLALCAGAVLLSASARAASNEEIVLHAADATLRGHWTRTANAKAPGDEMLTTPDKKWSHTNAALAYPQHFVEFTLDAPANTAYHIWLRLRAAENSKGNDSVFVQLSDAVTENGARIYRIGTTSALAVTLQSCDDCPLSGAGWVDGSFGMKQTPVVEFAESGSHTLRIQTREDGVQVDQVVLSPAAFLTSAPGSRANDSTLVSKSGTIETSLADLGESSAPLQPAAQTSIKPIPEPAPAPSTASAPLPLPAPPAKPAPREAAQAPRTSALPALTSQTFSAPVPAYAPPLAPSASSTTAGNTVMVIAGGNLQAAIDSASPGDTILLQAGATFVGNFRLTVKGGNSYITIRSSADDSQLPGPAQRITPAHASLLPKLKSPNSSPAIATDAGAHHYRLQFLEFPSTYQGFFDIIALGNGTTAQNSIAKVPYELILDRVYIHGDRVYGQKRGVALNSASTKILNSHISDIKAVGQDTQAISGWNGPGPYHIENNFIEAAGENVMFGGTDPAIANLVPSDITIRRNHIFKPLTWRTEGWTVRSLLEFRNAQRVVVDANVIENNWQSTASGFAVAFTVRSDGNAHWSVVQNVLFSNNLVRHVPGAIEILGYDTTPTQETNNIVIRNNLFEDVSATAYGGSGGFLLVNGGRNIVVDHNTAIVDGNWTVGADRLVSQSFVFTNNIIPDNASAIVGTGTTAGIASIAQYFPGSTIVRNVIAGPSGHAYPEGNFFPPSLAEVLSGYRLPSNSPYRLAATDGKDIGVDIDALNTAVGTTY